MDVYNNGHCVDSICI